MSTASLFPSPPAQLFRQHAVHINTLATSTLAGAHGSADVRAKCVSRQRFCTSCLSEHENPVPSWRVGGSARLLPGNGAACAYNDIITTFFSLPLHFILTVTPCDVTKALCSSQVVSVLLQTGTRTKQRVIFGLRGQSGPLVYLDTCAANTAEWAASVVEGASAKQTRDQVFFMHFYCYYCLYYILKYYLTCPMNLKIS